ncbi:MAG: alpha/beta hydrolase [Nevskia sp.]|nr:alpha/beta hydrolase [Nevskia sp.]
MPYAAVNGQRLYYEDSGGERPVLAFSHGLLMDHEMFAPQVAAFKDRYRCIVWDERGHGRTAGERIEPFTYYDSADDLAALLAHLGVREAVLVGMSQGGYLSLRCALTHPQLVRALILIDTQAQTEDPSKTPAYRQMLETWAAQGLPEAIADTIAQIILGPAGEATLAGGASAPAAAVDLAPIAAAWKAKWRTWQPHNLMACFETLVGRDDLSPRLGEIQAPTLVIHGEADIAITLDRARDMAARLPHAEWVTIPGAGHASNLTHPAPVNAAIERFLARL